MKADTKLYLSRFRMNLAFWLPAAIGLMCTWGMIGVLVAGVKAVFF